MQDALRRWEPGVMVTKLRPERLNDVEGNKVVLRLPYNVIATNVAGNEVLVEGVERRVAI